MTAIWLLIKGGFGVVVRLLSAIPWFLYVGALVLALWAITDLKLENSRLRKAVATVESLLKTEKAERAIERDKALVAANDALLERMSITKQLFRQKENADAERIRTKALNDQYVASLRRQLDGVRGDIAAFAAGSRPASDDSVADCRRRADALGHLLEQALFTSAELAGDAENEAADARALRQAPSTGEVKP